MIDYTQGAPYVPAPVPFYTANPPIKVTLLDASGRAFAVVTTAEPDIAVSLRVSDLGWLRGERLYVGDGEIYQLPAGAYTVDPATREITLS